MAQWIEHPPEIRVLQTHMDKSLQGGSLSQGIWGFLSALPLIHS